MGIRRFCEIAAERLERAAQFGHAPGRALAHGPQRIGVFRIRREIGQFVGIVLQVVKELMVAMVEIADVFEVFIPQAFKGGNAASNREVLVECSRQEWLQ